jgi:RNA polymerase sigma-70 factor (ECF subfamily)
MIEDEVLKWRFKHGSRDALRRIYEKYRDYLLTLAIALLNDVNAAEDVLHDVFVAFVVSSENFKLRGSLKAYLATCVINRARDYARSNRRHPVGLHEGAFIGLGPNGPAQLVICNEESEQLNSAIAQLPYEQREAVSLHLIAGMKFREIAQLQSVTVNTIKGRYRYGLNKLRSLLNSEVK